MFKRKIKDEENSILSYMLFATICYVFLFIYSCLPAECCSEVPQVFGCSFGICQQVLRCYPASVSVWLQPMTSLQRLYLRKWCFSTVWSWAEGAAAAFTTVSLFNLYLVSPLFFFYVFCLKILDRKLACERLVYRYFVLSNVRPSEITLSNSITTSCYITN